MRRIDLASAGFLLLEKRETPMHVGGVNLFTLPEGADEQEFLTSLRTQLRENTEFRKPFGEYVVTGKTGLYWEKDEHIDMDYHVRHSALPSPGRYRELFALASRFHTTLLDRTRPLWELHLIEGLQDRQFAVYNKVHHAAIDGVGAMHITQAMCTESPNGPPGYAPYSLEAYEAYKQSRFGNIAKTTNPSKRDMRNVLEALKQQYDSSINLATAMRRFGLAFVGRSGNLAVPWHNVPKTSINTRVSGARRFVAQTFAFDRVKEVCRGLDATVNDVVLAMCAGALRRYLLSRDELPLHSLKAMAPVSLREEGDVDSSNAIGFITADMATNIYDPEKRLRTIQESMRAGKDLLRELSPAEGALFMQLTQLPALLTSILGLGSKFPAFSTVVSNVPGPKKPLYWHGARLDGIYPASIVFDGFAMNITLVSYHDQLDFGIVACRRSLPQIQRIIDHLEDSLAELETVAGISGSAARSNNNRRSSHAAAKTRVKAKAKTRSKVKTKASPKAKAKTPSKAKPAAKTKAKRGARKSAVKPKLARK
ncbi:wax ester/triacylglycerol synthase family O-acyltransferase [Congregibacter brevis]|uniref:diacylglycerol O-acyltransferase n=1 Tax=Congregibacter brevis TaxID=3081201 RepID=A0ABZ0IAC9_9GAMM|nr:wax ester/triacylglycerol synthase family O-acyltransferase [Congregibacter sp. IMCC45268]